MWRKLPFPKIIQIRSYVPRSGGKNLLNSSHIRPMKTLEGKMKTIQSSNSINEKINDRLSKNEIQTSEEYLEDPEGFGDLESDFMSANISHREYLKDSAKHKEQIRHWIIKNKYFKEKLPNFLTYAEKEQIKLLNSRDPDEWTPEKLSESFPANPQIISKILKAKWIARSEKRIKLHDEVVMKNWKMFKEGKFINLLNKDLLEHLQKFANRTPEDLKNVNISERVFLKLPTPKTTEFLDIIKSCKKYVEKTKLIEENVNNDKQIELKNSFGPSTSSLRQDEETYVIGKILDKRKMRFNDLKNENLLPTERNDVNRKENPESTDVLKIIQEDMFEKFKTTEIVINEEDKKKFEISTIKERIHIPRRLWKRGATYKVEDCYYDDDGEFLYRVPGMTGRKV